MKREKLFALLRKYRQGTLTDEERTVLETWYRDTVAGEQVKLDQQQLDKHVRAVRQLVMAKTKPERQITKYAVRIAALLLLGLGISFYFHVHNQPQERELASSRTILPSDGSATLTLGNGHTISLSSSQELITSQDDQFYYGDSTLVTGGENSHATNIGYATLNTPKGRQYRILLPDGTLVWLNAASTLRYPTRFESQQRKVFLEGEAYFEVKRQDGPEGRHVPFIVSSADQEIEVLGTQFNVRAYPAETVSTTLVEGKVRVKALAHGHELVLKPGQAAVSMIGHPLRLENNADLKAVLAWKSGLFRFDNTPLFEILAQLSNWYDIEVAYEGTIPDRRYYGVIRRDNPLQDILQILEAGGVNFRVEVAKGNYKLFVYE